MNRKGIEKDACSTPLGKTQMSHKSLSSSRDERITSS